MVVVTSVPEMLAFSDAARGNGKTIGFVPTMGALHRGHLALISKARSECDLVVVSIFVNPLQFAPSEDYESYPRLPEQDAKLAAGSGVDCLFCPGVSDIYPMGLEKAATVEVGRMGEVLCGANRPGHFNGVATVVTRLHSIVEPHRSYFGEKDYQQLQIIRRATKDSGFPIEIVGVATVREPDGLACSSRNRYLNKEERRRAVAIYRSLRIAEHSIRQGVMESAVVEARGRQYLEAVPGLTIEYFTVSDAETLEPVAEISGKVVIAVAARLGTARLIDNVVVDLERYADNGS